MDKESSKSFMKNLKSQLKNLIFNEETNFRNEFLRMSDQNFDLYIKTMLDIMWHIEGNNTSIILKDNFDTNTNLLNFMCKTAAVMVRYSTFFINTNSPEFFVSRFHKRIHKQNRRESIS